jgi:hypothetical protein
MRMSVLDSDPSRKAWSSRIVSLQLAIGRFFHLIVVACGMMRCSASHNFLCIAAPDAVGTSPYRLAPR